MTARRKPAVRPDPSVVFAALRYDPECGIFYWRHRDDKPKSCNNRFAGKPAGVRDKFYIYICIDGRSYPAHVLAFLFIKKRWPEGLVDQAGGRMTNPLSNRAALKAASAAFRQGRLPGRDRANRIADTLDAMARAISIGTEPVGTKSRVIPDQVGGSAA